MSVRAAILGLLTLGPAYGHQLLFEIHTRLPHRASVNPGQVYSTLTRLAASGAIEGAGLTTSNLPQYQLSTVGRELATAWLRGESSIDVGEWVEVLDVVVLAFTLPDADLNQTRDGIERLVGEWIAGDASHMPSGADEVPSPQPARDVVRSLESLSRESHARAIAEWLAEVSHKCESGARVTWGFNDERPGRGRRPNLVK